MKLPKRIDSQIIHTSIRINSIRGNSGSHQRRHESSLRGLNAYLWLGRDKTRSHTHPHTRPASVACCQQF